MSCQSEHKGITHHPKGSSADVGPRSLTSSEIGPAPSRVGNLAVA